MPHECSGETSQVLIWVTVWAYKFWKQSFNQDYAWGGRGQQELKKAKSHDIGCTMSWPPPPPGQGPCQVHMPGAAGDHREGSESVCPWATEVDIRWRTHGEGKAGLGTRGCDSPQRQGPWGWCKGGGLHESGKGRGLRGRRHAAQVGWAARKTTTHHPLPA